MSISALRFNSVSLNQIGQDKAIIVVGGQPAASQKNIVGGVLDRIALNPQPLPPKEGNFARFFSRLGFAALNPQPLPPKAQPDPSYAALTLRRLVG